MVERLSVQVQLGLLAHSVRGIWLEVIPRTRFNM